LARARLPIIEHLARLLELVGAINHEDRLAVDAQRARIGPRLDEVIEVSPPRRHRRRMRLQLQDLMFLPVPAARPGLVRPRQAERDVEILHPEEQVRRRFEQLLACEPIMIMAKTRYPVFARHFNLAANDATIALIVITVLGNARLIVAGKERARAFDVDPVGESRAPPAVILGNGVKLRKIDRDEPDVAHIARHNLAGLRAASKVCYPKRQIGEDFACSIRSIIPCFSSIPSVRRAARTANTSLLRWRSCR